MRNFLLIFALMAVFLTGAAQADQNTLTVDLAENHIDITTGFNGSRLVLFGTQEQKGRIAIIFTGPQRTAVVRRKESVGGAWINRSGMTFENVPSYYDYAIAGEESDLALPEVLKKEGVGAASLLFEPEEKGDISEIRMFQEALIRNKKDQRLFHTDPEKITYLNDHFFRTTFYIPPNVPTGDYQIRTLLFRNGGVEEIKTLDVKVAQVGTSANIYKFSHTHSMIYGLICVAMAMAIGWLSSLVRRV